MADPISFDPYLDWVDVVDPNNIPEGARVVSAADLLRYEQLGQAVTARLNDTPGMVADLAPGIAAAPALAATYVPKWKANTAYLAGDKVLSPSGDVVSAIAAFTSGASYSAANWNLSTSYVTAARSAALAAAANQAGLPPLETMPPTVYVDNNQGIDGAPLANTRLTAVPLSGWYTSVAPTDTTKRRYFAPSAPINSSSDPFPDTWSVSFTNGGRGPASFVDEHRMSGGQKIQYMFKQQASSYFRIMVNGKYLTPTPVLAGGTAGQFGFVTIDFGAPLTTPADIRFEGVGFRYYGIKHEAASTITKCPGPDPKKLVLAFDSYGGGAGTVSALSSGPVTMGWLLGYRAIINSSIGGSGYIAGGNLGEPAFKDRVSEIVATGADTIVVGIGHNDTASTNTAIQSAANTFIAGIRAGLPSAKIIVMGPMFSSSAPGTYAAMQTAIFAGVSSVSGVVTVDTTGRPWVTDSNYDLYISSDNTHPVQAGHDYLGYYLAGLVKLATAERF